MYYELFANLYISLIHNVVLNYLCYYFFIINFSIYVSQKYLKNYYSFLNAYSSENIFTYMKFKLPSFNFTGIPQSMIRYVLLSVVSFYFIGSYLHYDISVISDSR